MGSRHPNRNNAPPCSPSRPPSPSPRLARTPRTRLPTKRWHQLLGELRSMSPNFPGTRGLFSVFQAALSRGNRRRVRLNQHVYDAAADFRALVNAIADRPTRLQKLVPTAPSDIGACDACSRGMSSIWFDALDSSTAPVPWQHYLPTHITASLVTTDSSRGTISISDVELAGVIAHHAGPVNVMADDASRLWDLSHLRVPI
jgi:hypothetical protein